MKSKMTAALKTFFTRNVGYKLAAFLMGIVVWALLSNTEDPITTKDVYVPLTYLYEEKLLSDEQLCILSAPSTVRVTVQARTSSLTQIKADLFSATADLMSHSGGDVSSQLVHVDVNQISGFDVVLDWNYYKNDPTVTVVMDHYMEKSFQVSLIETGDLPEGLFLGSTDFEPGMVTVGGPMTKFGNLASVKASLDLSELAELGSGFFDRELELEMYDSNDKVIQNTDGFLTMSSETTVLYSVIIREKTLALAAEGTVGVPQGDRRVAGLSVEPELLEVNGLDTSFTDVTEILIPASEIDVTGLTGDADFSVDVAPYLPEGVTAAGDSVVTVHVSLESMETVYFTYSAADLTLINQDPDYEYAVEESSSVTLRVRGYREDLENLNKAELSPVLDLYGLSEGRNRVKVSFTEVPGVIMENADSLVFSVTKTGKEQETLPSETQSAEETPESVSSEETEKLPEETDDTGEETPDTSETDGTQESDDTSAESAPGAAGDSEEA